jgi:hypothetical protein
VLVSLLTCISKGTAAKTQKNYLQPIIQFSQWLKRSPDTLTKEEI